MLRCNVAGLIPLMASQRYGGRTEELYGQFKPALEAVMRTGSYYLLRKLPASVAGRLLTPGLAAVLSGQRKDGLWARSQRITYDILSAIKHTGAGEIGEILKYDPLGALEGSADLYALLIRRHIYNKPGERDSGAIAQMLREIKDKQAENGSWDATVIGTAVQMETLLDLGADPQDAAVRRGSGFLFANFHDDLQGMHTKAAYGLTGHGMFTSEDRYAEFDTALRLRPQWIPRAVCFRTLAVIQTSVCLTLLLRLGLESDARVVRALDNIHDLITAYGGLCASNIKKPFL